MGPARLSAGQNAAPTMRIISERPPAGRMCTNGPQAAPLCWLEEVTVPLAASTSPQSQGRPVLGHTRPPLGPPLLRPSFVGAPPLPQAPPLPLLQARQDPLPQACPLWPLLAVPLAPAPALLAAIASSVYAAASTLANALKASRMGRYPVQRLQGRRSAAGHAEFQAGGQGPGRAEDHAQGASRQRCMQAAGGAVCGGSGDAPQIASQRLLDLLLRGRLGRLAAQQRHHAHHKAGGAEAALRAVRACQPLLDGVQPVARVAHALHRDDVAALGRIQRAQAGVDRAMVQRAVGFSGRQQDGAGAAAALAASQFGPRKTQFC